MKILKILRFMIVFLFPLAVIQPQLNHYQELSKMVIPYSEIIFVDSRAYTTIDIGGDPMLVSTPGPIGNPQDVIEYGKLVALFYYIGTAIILFIITDLFLLVISPKKKIRSTFSPDRTA